MLSDDPSQIPLPSHASSSSTSVSSKVTTSPSFQLLSACTSKQKTRDRRDSSSTDSSSSRTVIRQTTSWRWVVVFGSFCVHFIANCHSADNIMAMGRCFRFVLCSFCCRWSSFLIRHVNACN